MSRLAESRKMMMAMQRMIGRKLAGCSDQFKPIHPAMDDCICDSSDGLHAGQFMLRQLAIALRGGSQ